MTNMINIIWYCKKCGYVNSDIYSYIPRLVKKGICPICKNKLNEIQENITYFQSHTEMWQDVVRNKYLKDINLDTEASNKRSNMEQKRQEEIKNLKNNSSTTEEKKFIPKCPICGSPNVKHIGAGERTLSVLTLGLLSNKINKSFKCNDCGGTF